jgi:hypothetical protein
VKIFGYIPIAVILALFIGLAGGQFVADRADAVHANSITLNVEADTFQHDGGEELRWARIGSGILVTVFDPADHDVDSVVGADNDTPDSDVIIEAKDGDGKFDPLTMFEIDPSVDAGTGTIWSDLTFEAQIKLVLAASAAAPVPLVAGLLDDATGTFVGAVTLTAPGVGLLGTELATDEEDKVTVDYSFRTKTFETEADLPDVDNMEPDDGDVVDDNVILLVFEATDDDSGLTDQDDLDIDNIAILLSAVQCSEAEILSPFTDSLDISAYRNLDDYLFGPGGVDIGLNDVTCGTAADPILVITVPDSDLEAIPGGFEVKVDLNLSLIATTENDGQAFIGVVTVDDSGNFNHFDVDSGSAAKTFNKITVDDKEPVLTQIRTGVRFDASDNAFDNDGEEDWLQLIFTDITDLDPDSIDLDDIIVEGHDVRRVVWFDVDPDELEKGPESSGGPFTWAERPSDIDGKKFTVENAVCEGLADDSASTTDFTFDCVGLTVIEGHSTIADGVDLDGDLSEAEVDDSIFAKGDITSVNAQVKRMIFVQLEDDVDADADEFDITIVPNGVEDEAGNRLDGGDDAEGEAEDWIAPSFTLLEMTGGLVDDDGRLLAGEDDEIVLVITSDEELAKDPKVVVTFIDCADFKDDFAIGDDDKEDDKVAPPNISCVLSVGRALNADVDEIGRDRWRVEIDEPKDTGFYNILITGTDDSDQDNVGSEGRETAKDPDTGKLIHKFFDGGDPHDDAIFFEGDVLLPTPFVRIGGEDAKEEPEVEFRNPFFVEIDFTTPFDKTGGTDENDLLDENNEYEDDHFDDVEIILFDLDGVDLTDQVSSTDGQKFLIAIEDISIGEHEITINAIDQAGNELEDELELDFEVEERDDFELEVNPGWNLVSLPGDPEDTAIDSVFPPGVPVTTKISWTKTTSTRTTTSTMSR